MDGWWVPTFDTFQTYKETKEDPDSTKKASTGKVLDGETEAEPCTEDVDGKKACKSEMKKLVWGPDMTPIIAYGLNSWFHILWYIVIWARKDDDWKNLRTDAPKQESGFPVHNHFFADGFSFVDLTQTAYTVSFIVGMILYPVEAILWPMLIIEDREFDFMIKRIFYYMSMVQYWGVPTATWIGPVIMFAARIISDEPFEGPFLTFLVG